MASESLSPTHPGTPTAAGSAQPAPRERVRPRVTAPGGEQVEHPAAAHAMGRRRRGAVTCSRDAVRKGVAQVRSSSIHVTAVGTVAWLASPHESFL